MATPAVHWYEGMFLRPHHFMTAQRHWLSLADQGERFDLHYNWGLRAVTLDLDALANARFVVRALRARLRDGTLVTLPDDGVLPALDLKPAFERGNTLTVYLAVPVFNSGRPNVAAEGAADPGAVRYVLGTQMLEDENTGVNPQPIKVRMLNL